MDNSINRIRLEFKEENMPPLGINMVKRINRIRLEFKDVDMRQAALCHYCINRIRLEFKAIMIPLASPNWKCINRIRLEFKVILKTYHMSFNIVLIESDWNLKWPILFCIVLKFLSINRIRLEFKGVRFCEPHIALLRY